MTTKAKTADPYAKVKITDAYGRSALKVIDYLFDGYGPASALEHADLIPNRDWPRGTRQFLDAIFADPDLYALIHQRHARGERFSALAGSYLDDYEWEHGLPWSIPEWHEEPRAEPNADAIRARDFRKLSYALEHGARA